MLARTAVSALNHLLTGEAWARERLRAHAGRHLRLAAGPVNLELTLDGEGFFRQPDSAAPGGETAVTIELPADALLRLPFDRSAVFAAARLSGTADMAETLAFVFRNLRWDVEEDLASLFGDVIARRIVLSGRAFAGWQQQSARNLAANLAEYLGEEAEVLLTRRQMNGFQEDLRQLGSDLVRLEDRLAAQARLAT